MKKTDILILGAGCAGTSLAHYLEDFGYQGKIVLLDGRTDFNREQRWCSWSKKSSPLLPIEQKSWNKWTVRGTSQTVVRTSEKFVYRQIYAPDFFRYFHSRWQNSSAPIQLSSGETVESIEDGRDFVEVTTDREVWKAKMVFDARHRGSRQLENLKKSPEVYLHQTFVGWTIRFETDVFEATSATLMDFRTAQTSGINFIYVLPYSAREALVESTSFSTLPTDRNEHSDALKTYIAENYGEKYQIKSEESGELPMSCAELPVKLSEKVFAVGVAGGCARPSSGYAFQRIQRQTSQIAEAIVGKKPIPEKFASRKYNFFDAVFLEAISRQPECSKEFFLKMFEKVEPEALIRFLSDESGYLDDLAVVAALPKRKFAAAWLKSLRRDVAEERKRNDEIRLSQSTLPNSLDKFARWLAAWRVER